MKIILNNISSISSKCQREFSSLVARAPETQSQVQVEYKVWAVSSVPYHITLLVMYEEKEKKTGDRKEEVLNLTGVFSLKNGRWEPGMHGAALFCFGAGRGGAIRKARLLVRGGLGFPGLRPQAPRPGGNSFCIEEWVGQDWAGVKILKSGRGKGQMLLGRGKKTVNQ